MRDSRTAGMDLKLFDLEIMTVASSLAFQNWQPKPETENRKFNTHGLSGKIIFKNIDYTDLHYQKLYSAPKNVKTTEHFGDTVGFCEIHGKNYLKDKKL